MLRFNSIELSKNVLSKIMIVIYQKTAMRQILIMFILNMMG